MTCEGRDDGCMVGGSSEQWFMGDDEGGEMA